MLNLQNFHSEDIAKSIQRYNLDKAFVAFDKDSKNTIIFFQGKAANLVENSSRLNTVFSEYIYDAEFENEINEYNVYEIYLATDTFLYEDFIKIRSDTFFSKKIVVNNYVGNLEDDQENIINRYVLHNNINLESLNLDIIINNLSEMPSDYPAPNPYPKRDHLNDCFAQYLFDDIKNSKNKYLNLWSVDEYINNVKSIRILVIIDVLAKLILRDNYKIDFITTNENFKVLFQKKYDEFIEFDIKKTFLIKDFLRIEEFEVSLTKKH